MHALAIIALTIGFYAWLAQKTAPLFSRIILRLMTFGRQSVYARLQVARLLVATVQQMLFFLLLLWLTQMNPLHGMALDARNLLVGIFLGLGLMGTASLLCQVAVGITDLVTPSPELRTMADWQVLLRGGWMGQFYQALEILPYWLIILLTSAYVSVEEVLFRSLLIESFLLYGQFPAWALSLALFLLAQWIPMPNWRSSLFPLVGAGTLGAIHGFLYLRDTNIAVLVVSHIAFFMLAVRRRECLEG